MLGLAALVGFSACSKENQETLDIIQSGSWRVTSFVDDSVDETSHFTGYVFNFSNGTVTATKDGSSKTGTYSSGKDNGKEEFVINFGTTSPWDELTDDWHVIEKTETKLRLEDSDDDGETEVVIFERI